MKRVRMTTRALPVAPPEAPEAEDVEGASGKGIILRVNDDWRLVWDGLQFQVQKRQVSEASGRVYWAGKAYCRALDEAVMFLAARCIYTVPGTYDLEVALLPLTEALDQIREETGALIGKAITSITEHGNELYLTRSQRRRKH